jgi:hypothetical protein
MFTNLANELGHHLVVVPPKTIEKLGTSGKKIGKKGTIVLHEKSIPLTGDDKPWGVQCVQTHLLSLFGMV